MATAEPSIAAPGEPAIGGAGLELSRRWAWSGLAVVLLAGLGLRLWGVRQGLPYPYNTDEAQHFVPHAVEMFRKSTLNPHYFANPPAFTYLLHFLFRLSYGSAGGAVRALELHPTLVEAYRGLGFVLTVRGEWDAAVAASRRAIELQPDHAVAHSNLGNALKGRGDLDAALHQVS